jgi:hypothetical protein
MVGTSERLADKMEQAVVEKMAPDTVEKIVLSGEGRVNFRVDLLYDQVMHGTKEAKKRKGEKLAPIIPVNEEEIWGSASSTTETLVDESFKDETVVEEEPEEIMEPLETEPTDTTNLEKLTNSDAIIIAAHSQGVPVTVLLIARLIQEGVIDMEKKRVCIIGMAVRSLKLMKGYRTWSVSNFEITCCCKVY